MREILFRGKRIDDKQWIEGSLGCWYESTYILNMSRELIYTSDRVFPYTVGQYTGLEDKNGKRIFEGDIVRYVYEPGKGFWNANQLSVISYKKVGFHMEGIFGTNKYACMGGWLESIPFDQEAENIPEFEVIGNIHDNPELIAEVQK